MQKNGFISPGKCRIVRQEPLKLINALSLKVKDAGLYTCLASSLAGEDGKNHWVRVQGDTQHNLLLSFQLWLYKKQNKTLY